MRIFDAPVIMRSSVRAIDVRFSNSDICYASSDVFGISELFSGGGGDSSSRDYQPGIYDAQNE